MTGSNFTVSDEFVDSKPDEHKWCLPTGTYKPAFGTRYYRDSVFISNCIDVSCIVLFLWGGCQFTSTEVYKKKFANTEYLVIKSKMLN